MKRKITLLFLLATLPIITLSSQSLKDTVFQSYRFGVDSLEKTCIIDVPSGCDQLYVRVRGGLNEGKCKVIFKNIEDVWQNNLQLGYYDTNNTVHVSDGSLKFQSTNKEQREEQFRKVIDAEMDKLDNSSSKIKGTIIRTVYRPQEGQWKVVMIPEKAEAVIEVEYSIQ